MEPSKERRVFVIISRDTSLFRQLDSAAFDRVYDDAGSPKRKESRNTFLPGVFSLYGKHHFITAMIIYN